MDLWIYSEDFELLGIVDTASSIIWANRFRQCGDFEVYVQASAAMLDLLQIDRIVVRPGDEMACFIEKVEITTDEENGDFMTVSGRCLRSILDRRIVWDQTQLSGTLENAMRRLVTDAFISPAIAARKYDGLALAEAHGYTDTVSAQYTGTNLLEAIEELCATKNYGFKITMERDGWRTGGLVLDIYRGVDRSMNQSESPRVVFSEEYDNLTTTTYTKDKKAYKTVALVAGEGEGSARRRTIVSRSEDQAGLHRRELYVDARDISSNEGEISDSAYFAQLSERGSADLAEATIIESMDGAVEALQMYTYGVDYSLGDLVTVRNKHGIQADAQVLEVVEVWDENGYTCTPTFG